MFTFACKTCHPWKCKKSEWCTQGVARNGWGVEAHTCCWSSWQKRDNVFHFEFTSDIMTRKILTSKDTLVSIIFPPLSNSGLHQHSKIRPIHIEHVKYTKQFKHYQDQDILWIPSPFVDNKWLMSPCYLGGAGEWFYFYCDSGGSRNWAEWGVIPGIIWG